jgi:1-aminocyclopropane-1-carboxylate deaminase/D-cysteine desulfhydrase-like pyridoxal-dependent ACC family enzyme
MGRTIARMQIDALPRFRLFEDPSPFHRLERLSAALGGRVDIWIKREDLLPVAFGGNKLRNLEFLVGEALAERADTLITSGRRWSNHARLTAAAGAMAGLDVHLVLSGPPADPPGPGIRLATALGATVHQLDTADREARSRRVIAVQAELRAAGKLPYIIGVGGAGPIGAVGQLLAGREAFAQAADAGIAVDTLYLPTATGGTQAGLTLAAAAESPATAVVGVIVARTPAELERVIADTLTLLSGAAGATVAADAIRFDRRRIGEGYGRRTADGDEAARLIATTEGILVDPIYTAKALAGLVAAVRDGRHDGQTVLFWHAGGTPGIFEPLET